MEKVTGVIPMNSTPPGKVVAIVMGESATRLRSMIAERRAAFEEFEQYKLSAPSTKEANEKYREASKKFDQKTFEIDTRIATLIEFNCIFVPEIFG